MTASDRSGHQAALDAARRLGNNRHVSTPTTSSTAPATTAQRPAAILVEPLAAVIPNQLRLRDDVITDGDVRDKVLANAPQAEHGFFTVPKVIE